MVNSMESYAKMHVGASEAGTMARLCVKFTWLTLNAKPNTKVPPS